MPIYAYKCGSCGFAKDVLQKMSDLPLTDCPACGVGMFKKQLTAAGFQLKGSGWYATDFKGGTAAAPATPANEASAATDSAAAGSAKPAAGVATKADSAAPAAASGASAA